jgi:hypothetical protein
MHHVLSSFVSAVSQLWKATAYHPERHYMRGPGPKWREKHSMGAPQAQRAHMRIDHQESVFSSR